MLEKTEAAIMNWQSSDTSANGKEIQYADKQNKNRNKENLKKYEQLGSHQITGGIGIHVIVRSNP